MWPFKKPEPEIIVVGPELPHDKWPECYEFDVCIRINEHTHKIITVMADKWQTRIFKHGSVSFVEYSPDGKRANLVLYVPMENLIWIRETKRFIPELRKHAKP